MSSLFPDAMRDGLIANVTGVAWSPEEQAERLAQEERAKAARAGLCPSAFDFYEDRFLCDQPDRHMGDHRVIEDDPESTHRWELRWSERD